MKQIQRPSSLVWRMRAQHNRALSEHMSNQSTRDNLLRLAADYEVLAQQEDEHAEAAQR